MRKLSITLSVLLICASAAAPQRPAAAPADEGFEGISRPSDDRALAFTRPGMIAKVFIEDGDYVEANQALIELDNEAELVQLDQLKAEAEDTIRIQAANAKLALSKVKLQRVQNLFDSGAATDLELREAQLELKMQELSLDVVNLEHLQNERKFQEAKIILNRMRLVSPIAGRVEGLAVREGEAAEALGKIIRVVVIDPLWIQVWVPICDARELTEGGPARVTFCDADGERETVDGKIKFVRSVAQYTVISKLEVRVEVPNPSRRPAGEKVIVTFPPPERAGEEKKVQDKVAVESKVKE